MGRIAVLSDELINKIAAGEVVERPASVVKELCENAIDAGAKAIRVSLAGGGLERIVISDDGFGMSREDALLALSRHATSKLADLEGLFTIQTMGFRGEALPAIASVSRFELTTSEPDARSGTVLRLEGGERLEVSESAAAGGTVIRVEDLFFNTPARRKFLKRDETELKHCEEAVIRLALAHPEIGFFADHVGLPLLSCAASPEDPRERIAAALGPEVYRHLLAVEERRLGLTVTGHIASPEYSLPNARGLYTFVNRRYVRDRGLNHAVQRAFQEVLPVGRQPVAVLFIEIDPAAVDVNVHPQKLEVRFTDPRGIYEAVHAAVSRAVKGASWLQTGPGVESPAPGAAHYAMAVEQFLSRAQSAERGGQPLLRVEDGGASVDAGRALSFGEARPGINEAPPPGFFSGLRYLGALGQRFWVCEGHGGTLVVIDPHAAVERARLHALREAFVIAGRAEGQGDGQRLLFSASVELGVAEARTLIARLDALARLGIEVEPFGGTTLALKAVPPALAGVEPKALLVELATALPAPGHDGSLAAFAEALRVMACHAAAGAEGHAFTNDERRRLFAELDTADFHPRSVHAAVVTFELPLLELERRAGRRRGSSSSPPEN